MAEYTVSDIKGKGFKYEQYAQEQISDVVAPTGTFGCFIGTSNWGPINTPYIITGGLSEFRDTFGYAGTRIDHAWTAADLHFKANSALGIYTRIADEAVASRSFLLLKDKIDKPAIVKGSKTIRNGILISNTNKLLSLYLKYKENGDIAKELSPVLVDFSDYLSNNAELSGTMITTPIEIGTAQAVVIQIDYNDDQKNKFIFTIQPTSSQIINNVTEFKAFIENDAFTKVIDKTGVEVTPKPLISDFLTISVINNNIYLKTKILNYSFKVTDVTKIFSKITPNYPVKTPYVSILEAINKAINKGIDENNQVTNVADYSIASIDYDGNLILTGINTGTDSIIYVNTNSTITGDLGLATGTGSEGDKKGSQGTAIGTFRAKYRGIEGNTIQLRFYEDNNLPNLGIYFRKNLVGNLVDYNFNSSSDYFIGTQIDNDPVLNKILKYDHALKFFDFVDEDDSMAAGVQLYENDGITPIRSNWQIESGLHSLTGGDSGENGDALNYNILSVIEELKNIDLYQIDYIVAPGYEEENVQNAMLNLCAYRQDCFAFLDMPLITGITRRDAVIKATRYINGNYLRTDKINSIYGYLAFPYVRIRKRYYNTKNELVSDIALVSPTTILPYLYTLKDINSGTTFDMAAGESYGGRILLDPADFSGVQFILNQEDRDLLYADSLDMCINPIAFNTNAGFFVDGQKTTLRKNLNGRLTSLSRVSVMRTGLFIKKTSHRISRQYFFAPIDPTTWKDFANKLNREVMQPLLVNRMIEPNYILKCDSSTNTAQVRNNNGMVAYLEFTPYKKLERIKLIANITESETTVTAAE